MVILVVILIFALCIWFTFILPGVGLLASPVLSLVCAGLSLFAREDPNIAAFLLSITFFPITLIILKVRSREAKPPRWPYVAVNWIIGILWYSFGFLLLGALFQPLGPVLFVLFVTFTIRYHLTSRNSLNFNVVSILTSSMRQNLPLPMALDSAAGNDPSKTGRILRHISHWLKSGYSLSEAIQMGYPKCPSEVLATITVSERIHQLPRALQGIEMDMVHKSEGYRKVQAINLYYPITVLFIAMMAIGFLTIFIIPTFAEILKDMSDGAKGLPYCTQVLFNIVNFIMGHAWIVCSVLLALLLFFIASLFVRFRPRRTSDPYLLSQIGDWVRWHLPFQGWFERKHSLLRTVGILHSSLQAGCTVDQAIVNALEIDTNICFRKRLRRWFNRVVAGEPPAQAARQTSVGYALAWAFDDRVNQSNTLQILDMLEETYRDNYNYRANLARAVAIPVMILLLGCMIGFVVYSLFMPLIELNRLFAGSIYP
ncbi:MAG: type II secretion system F family protein [Sedimentisphaerales bacterium]|nr:type II secretion system F family protein [Sedimentisphaerales bacterium]